MRLNRRTLVATLALAAVGLPVAASVPAVAAPARSADELVDVIVGSGAGGDAAAAAVAQAGGQVTLHLDLLDGVGARVPATAVAGLEAQGFTVAPDVPAHLVGSSFVPTGGDVQLDAMNPGAGWNRNAGAGVGVALVDTGVTNSPELAGRLVHGPDLSGEGNNKDTYGHGTFMAGLIAANGAHPGMAPGARIISVKVAGADGTTSLSKVIAGIGWVVVHQHEVGASVLNLSLGVEAPMAYRNDPLAAAVEAAWSTGLTVVVASGNSGAGRVTSPGHDPFVITAGATDTHGTATTKDDTVASWSGVDKLQGYSKPELLAPGVSVVSLRAPGSTIDTAFPAARIGTDHFRGSGTSMSTALTAGAAAVLLERHPMATPDDVKGALIDGADSIGKKVVGEAVNLAAADKAEPKKGWNQHHAIAFHGLGIGMHKMPWTGTRWSGTRWSGTRWSSEGWAGTRWSGSTWSGSTWSGTRWSGTRWSSDDWAGTRWSGTRWSGSTWSGTRWSADAWDGTRWSGTRWSSAGWGDVVPAG